MRKTRWGGAEMDHLTVDQIIEFVSMNKLDEDAIALSATVNGHIRKCEKCLKLVRAFQTVYDEFYRLNFNGDFKKFVEEAIEDAKNEKKKSSESQDNYLDH